MSEGPGYSGRKIVINTQQFAGFAAESAQDGEPVRIFSRCSVTSDDPHFYMFINQISNDFLSKAGVSGDSITKFFVVQHVGGAADIHLDYAAIVQAQVNRDVKKGESIYEHDISAINGYRPQGIELKPTDTVICTIKVGWRYGLYFDAGRNLNEDQVWQDLGSLYQQLHVDRVLANIRERARNAQRLHIITEGKTDWRHIESARQRLNLDIPLSYPTTDESLGDSALLQVCERLSKFGPPSKNKIVAIFDRDNPKILSELARRGPLDGYQRWGNNVFSLALPVPAHRLGYKNVCIEMLYTDADIMTTAVDGKRLYFTNELKKEILPGNVIQYSTILPVEAQELTKEPFKEEASLIIDDAGRHVGLSKSRFADLVYEGLDTFGSLDVSNFLPIFRILNDIMLDNKEE
ncbi:hypothetical protein GCM10029963_69230 [Micromonospora andamanensis]|uniref:hypothetical protein n=1 Tax=Micromonospora andamanensis TaxID=1287068 RepID=UPI00194EA1F8|nr:hypothetical protein [Micromonospora andamanensis]GIJ38902.1 hypothetical protein Vwe01_22270 [Micromonospora andamanensis]